MIAVTKTQRMLTSLVAAIPAGYLALLLVMAMLNHAGDMNMMTYIVMGLTLLAAAVAVLMPLVILIGGNRKPAPPKPAAKPKKGEDVAAIDDEVEVSEASSGSFGDDHLLAESSDFDLGDSNQDMLTDDGDLTTENLDDFDLDDEFEEEEKPKAKAKKKKR